MGPRSLFFICAESSDYPGHIALRLVPVVSARALMDVQFCRLCATSWSECVPVCVCVCYVVLARANGRRAAAGDDVDEPNKKTHGGN